MAELVPTRRVIFGAVGAIIAVIIVAIGVVGYSRFNRPDPIIIAFATSLTGPAAVIGNEARTATQLYLDDINSAGGINGHPVQLQVFDDQSLPSTATANVKTILDSGALAVLGHAASDTSVAAGPGYRTGHIAAVTGTASSDEITHDNPYYFRASSPNTAQGAFLATYIHTVLDPTYPEPPSIDLISSNAPYGVSFRTGFGVGNGHPRRSYLLKVDGNDHHLAESAAAIADQLAQVSEPRLIVIGVATRPSTQALLAIRRRGIQSPVILTASAASDSFVQQFATEPEERDHPGFFTDNLFALAPAILDSTGELGQTLASRYQQATGAQAGWFAAGAQDAARILVAALRTAHLTDQKEANREQVRLALKSFDRNDHAVPGITAPLWFDANREMPRPLQYGRFVDGGGLISAPLQLLQVRDPELIDVKHEIEIKHMVQVDDTNYWLQRVIYTGIDVTHLTSIDTKGGVFTAEAFLWMRYDGGDEVPTQIELPGYSGKFDAAHPLQSGVKNGLNYRLWRLSGNFKADLDLHDYPFDTQNLTIQFQNRDRPRERIAYAIDRFGLQLDSHGRSTHADEAFRDLQLWHVIAVRPFVDAFSIQSTLGDPVLFNTAHRIEYGGFDTEIVVRRNALAFMIKSLVPLLLLTLVVLATLFFPATLAKERATIPVTGILTSAVLLISISAQLPPLGYTVALEYIFYVFFGLCLMAMTIGFLGEILRIKGLARYVTLIDVIGRIAYVAVVLVTVWVFA